MKIPTTRRLACLTIAAATGLLPVLAAPIAAAPAAAAPDCRPIMHGAWIETVCGVYPTKDQCEAARTARGGEFRVIGDREALIGHGASRPFRLTCIGPDGGTSSTASVMGTSDGMWHLSHIGP